MKIVHSRNPLKIRNCSIVIAVFIAEKGEVLVHTNRIQLSIDGYTGIANQFSTSEISVVIKKIIFNLSFEFNFVKNSLYLNIKVIPYFGKIK